MEFNYVQQINNCRLDAIVYSTAMECNCAHQMDQCNFDAIVVPLPWSVTMHTKWTIATLMILLSHYNGV